VKLPNYNKNTTPVLRYNDVLFCLHELCCSRTKKCFDKILIQEKG